MIAIVRHSHTSYNIKGEMGRFCGSSDPVITERGVMESKQIGQFLKGKGYKRIISSPLKRAIQTAELINKIIDLPISTNSDLREIDYGVWEGLTKREIENQYSEDFAKFNIDPFSFTPPKGENPVNALIRFKTAFIELEEDSIVITHKTVSRLFLCEIEGLTLNEYRSFSDLKLGSITELSSIVKPKIVQLNYIKHLQL